MAKTVLVFGANGNLGSHFVNQALEAGCKIKAFLYSGTVAKLNKSASCKLAE
jgi:uncharacterized protein YbjT (DUF2867 family)